MWEEDEDDLVFGKDTEKSYRSRDSRSDSTLDEEDVVTLAASNAKKPLEATSSRPGR